MNTLKLKSVRVAKGLTQKELAERLCISEKTYNRKELGLVDFTRKEIQNISEELTLTLELVNEIFFENKLTNCISKDCSNF